MPEITAHHEAGHVWAALHYGAEVLHVTIEPEWDDGPRRYGDTQVAWPVGRMSEREFHRKSVLVALAGPVAEMIYLGQPNELSRTAEWSADWLVASDSAATLATTDVARMRVLQRCNDELFVLLNAAENWHQLATIVDHLLAHETLDQDMIKEIFMSG